MYKKEFNLKKINQAAKCFADIHIFVLVRKALILNDIHTHTHIVTYCNTCTYLYLICQPFNAPEINFAVSYIKHCASFLHLLNK